MFITDPELDVNRLVSEAVQDGRTAGDGIPAVTCGAPHHYQLYESIFNLLQSRRANGEFFAKQEDIGMSSMDYGHALSRRARSLILNILHIF